MKKGIFIGALLAFALFATISQDVTLLSAPEFFSPSGSKPPTIPIFPPVD